MKTHRGTVGVILSAAMALGATAPRLRPVVVTAALDTIVNPASADFVKRALAEANTRHAELFVLTLSTPGGLMESMRDITTAVVTSRVPVATFVYPSGARAASAGFFILLSGDIAAMAPGTNTGAAHPVGGQGEDLAKTENQKVMQDALAQIRSLASRRGRNTTWAEKAVSESLSYTESEAKDKGLIEIVARDVPDLLHQLDGRSIRRIDGREVTLHLADARVEPHEMSGLEKALGAVSHPNVAYILFLIGLVGLYFELAHPGAILPGVAGGIALLLSLWAFSVLPVNFAGIALIGLAILLFVLEIKVASHGVLTVGAIISLIVGSLLLFAGNKEGYHVDLGIVLPGALLAGGIVAALLARTLALRARPPRTGPEGLVGETGTVLVPIEGHGKVVVHGEYWDAEAAEPIAQGATVRVLALDGMKLRVEKADKR
jgi:membrane-bound serine protease (ClpP class)